MRFEFERKNKGAKYSFRRQAETERCELVLTCLCFTEKMQTVKTEREAETIRDIFLAKEEYLNAAFSAIDAKYENTDAFLHDGMNIPQQLIARFRSSVL